MIVSKNNLEPIYDTIEVDDNIYPILDVLWKSGYQTKFSCAGHDRFNKAYTIKLTLEEYERYKNEANIILVSSDSEFKIVLVMQFMTEIYIMFEEDYSFGDLPEGFELKQVELIGCDKKYTKISKTFDYNNTSDEETRLSIIKARENLLTWAKKLPKINENERKRNIKYE